MRCRRSSARGYWSEWSLGRNYTTHEKGGCGGTQGLPSARPDSTAAVAWPRSPLSAPCSPFSCCSPHGEAGRLVERSAGRGGRAAGGAAVLEGEHGRVVGGTGAAGASPWGPSIPAHPACIQAPRRQEANGRVLGYRVTLSPRRRGREPRTICNTTHTQCNFSAPVGTRRVYLSAYNAAGESAATEVVLLERKGEGSANLPRSKTSACPAGALTHHNPPPASSMSSQTGCCSLTPPQGRHLPGCVTGGLPSRLPTGCTARARGRAGAWAEAGGHRGAMQ